MIGGEHNGRTILPKLRHAHGWHRRTVWNRKGGFTFHGGMDEMIGICAKPMVEHNPGMTEAAAREMMGKFFPMLKRWKAK